MIEERSEEMKKRVDESWKEAIDREKGSSDSKAEEPIEVTFSLFVSGLMMEALVALGEAPNPITKKKESNMTHAKFLIDTLSMLQDKTKNNLAKDESNMLDSILYELRMRFVSKIKE